MAGSNFFQLLHPLFLSLLLLSMFPSLKTLDVCNKMERTSLLEFKRGLNDPSGLLSSWVGHDCCKWKGITCSRSTGHVVKLDLRNSNSSSSGLSGEINPTLLKLKRLTYLDLSKNNFQGNPIPKFMGSFRKLNYLNLSHTSLAGEVPSSFGNLSNLMLLDLHAVSYPAVNGGPSFHSFIPNEAVEKASWVSDLNWLSRLRSLEYLDLGYVNLSLASSYWLESINMLPNVKELRLSNCEINNFAHFLSTTSNFTSLSVLDLSFNNFNSSIPRWVFNVSSLAKLDLRYSSVTGLNPRSKWGDFCNFESLRLSHNVMTDDVSDVINGLSRCSNRSLEVLELSSNQLSGQLPDSIGVFKKLRTLEMYFNLISGTIPDSIGNISSLEDLDFSYNKMNGSIPETMGNLIQLRSMSLIQNPWRGFITENHLNQLVNLEVFGISSLLNSLKFSIGRNWVPPFSLFNIEITGCSLGPDFPRWLSTQNQISFMILSNVSISGTIPNWLWKLSPQMEWFDLSMNQITGTLPKSLEFSPGAWIDLSFNDLEGEIPVWPNLSYLILANNSFSGTIPIIPSLRYLDLSGNVLTGTIPSSIAKIKDLSRLDLSNNRLSGNVHNKWFYSQKLRTIDLSGNDLSGEIPSFCSIPTLSYLKLSQNNFSGKLSSSFKNCTRLSSLDLGENRLTGTIPAWDVESVPMLSELRMRANMFTGTIPKQLCSLPNLHILDFAFNNLSGTIPKCLSNLTALSSLISFTPQALPSAHYTYTPKLQVVAKGTQLTYTSTIGLVNAIDFSRNRLFGQIPDEITDLLTLGTLNLSRNFLTGKIPEGIGGMKMLETLDLSCNNLTGSIPQTMSAITSLSHLNLSHNDLSGPIPSTNQFQTFNDPSSFEGNDGLCGLPLSVKCSSRTDRGDAENNGEEEDDDDDDDDDEHEKLWVYVSTGLGFIVGFWVVCGSLVIKKTWRDAYYQCLENVKDRIILFVLIKIGRLKRTIQE